jgi:hypothetical protein
MERELMSSVPKRNWFATTFEWVRNLIARPREPYRRLEDPFPELDLVEVARRLRITERASDQGQRELPRSDVHGLDSVENDIVSFFLNEQARAYTIVDARLRALGERLHAASAELAVTELKATADKACAELALVGAKGQNELFEVQRRVGALDLEYRQFRHKHNLTREPDYPESRILHYGLLAMMLLLETVMNGFMLARGDEAGRLGGLTNALVLAALNLAVAGAAGRFIYPYSNHRSKVKRVVAYLAVSGISLLSITINLAVAHYREILGTEHPESAAREALARLLESAFALSELQGLLLFGLGIVFALIAFFDGSRMDDRYPGYGRMHRRAMQAREDFLAERAQFTDEAAAQRDAALADIQVLNERLVLSAQQWHNLQHGIQRLRTQFTAYQSQLESAARTILGQYRQANDAARTSPPPPHFATDWHIRHEELQSTYDSSRHQDYASIGEECRLRVMKSNDAALAAISSVSELVDGPKTIQAIANAI